MQPEVHPTLMIYKMLHPAGLSIDEIAEPAIAMLEVTASGTNGYRFDSL